MKKFIAAVAATVMLLGTELKIKSAAISAEIYPETMRIASVNCDNDSFTCETAAGFTYLYYGIEDFEVDDVVSCLMSDHGTKDDVTDDRILNVKYSGFYLK